MEDDTNGRLPIIGWREWVGLPDLAVPRIKAKVDSGARSSALHASQVESFEREGEEWVRFLLHPIHRKTAKVLSAEAPVLEYRKVRSSSGKASLRPVIRTQLKLLGETWLVDLTLADREQMGFRMLLGREAFRGRFLLDAGRSYYGGKPKRKRSKKQAQPKNVKDSNSETAE